MRHGLLLHGLEAAARFRRKCRPSYGCGFGQDDGPRHFERPQASSNFNEAGWRGLKQVCRSCIGIPSTRSYAGADTILRTLRISVVTFKTRAKARSSSSVTQRSCASIWDACHEKCQSPATDSGRPVPPASVEFASPLSYLRPDNVPVFFGSGHCSETELDRKRLSALKLLSFLSNRPMGVDGSNLPTAFRPAMYSSAFVIARRVSWSL
jgi:hypothetical protein